MGRVVGQVFGYLFLLLGIAGLFLPFLQGFLFIFVGLILLARNDAPWARGTLDWTKRRYPRLGRQIDRAEAWMTRVTRRFTVWFGRIFRPAAERR